MRLVKTSNEFNIFLKSCPIFGITVMYHYHHHPASQPLQVVV
jgi:hypothetical protein